MDPNMPSPVGGGRNTSPFSLARLATRVGSASRSANPSPVQGSVHGGSSAGESPTSIGASTHQSTRTYSNTQWEEMKKEIKYLYLEEDMPLQDVVNVLSNENGFHTNVRMCKTRLKRWGFTKNNSKNRKSSFRNETRPVKSGVFRKGVGVRLQKRKGPPSPTVSPIVFQPNENKAGIFQNSHGFGCCQNDRRVEGVNNVGNVSSTFIFNPGFNFDSIAPVENNATHSAIPTISELDTISHGSSRPWDMEKMLVDELPWKGVLGNSDPILVPSYEMVCPYRFGEKMFRLVQDYGNGASGWDSLGFGSDINLLDPRPCTSNCMCRGLDLSHPSFSFLVRMGLHGTDVKFFSDALWYEVMKALARCKKPCGNDRTVDGRVLFSCREYLIERSRIIYSAQFSGPSQCGNQALSLELELLLHGLFNHWAFRQYDTNASQSDQRDEECSSPDTPSDVSTPRSAVSLGSSLLKNLNPWRRLRAQWKNRRGQNRLQNKINKLDEVFQNEWLQYEVSPDSSVGDDPMWTNSNVEIEVAEMADTSILYPQPSGYFAICPIQELEGSQTQRYELYSEASSSFLSSTDGSPVDEQRQMDLDTEYNTSFDGSGTEVSPLKSVFDGEIFELNSRQLDTREEFDMSKAKNTEHRPFTVKDLNVSPTMANKLHYGTFSLTDQTVNAVKTDDSELVQALLDLLTDEHALDRRSREPPIYIAAKVGNLRVLRALLERGEDINRTDQRGVPPIYAAAAQGHVEVVRVLLQHGATVSHDSQKHSTSLLGVSAANGAHEVVRLLLNQQYSPDTKRCIEFGNSSLLFQKGELIEALALAAKSGSSATMQVLLEHGADVDLLLQVPATELTSVLIESAALGNYEMVKILLLTKVDVAIPDDRGTALSAAISNGHYAVARLLLKHSGGQVLAARQHLRSCGERNEIKRLLKLVSQTQRHRYVGDTASEIGSGTTNTQCLGRHFLRQHRNMLRASSASSTKFGELSLLYTRQEDTWNAAINTMQNLSRGKLPTAFDDIISFLCLSRAMADTLHEIHRADYEHDFDADLPRWQMLFMDDDKSDDLEAYRDAVASIWGVTLDSHHMRDPRTSISKRFRDFAATSADTADHTCSTSPIGTLDPTILEQINCGQIGSANERTRYPLKTGELSEKQRGKLPCQQPTPTSQPEETPARTLADEIDSDPTSIDSLATFLVAGAAFAIVIVYMQVISKLSKLLLSSCVDFPGISTLAQRYDLFESEVIHGLHLVEVEGICGNQYCWV